MPDKAVTSPLAPGKFRESRRNGIWAKGDVTALLRTWPERHGEVGIVEFGLYTTRESLYLGGEIRDEANSEGTGMGRVSPPSSSATRFVEVS